MWKVVLGSLNSDERIVLATEPTEQGAHWRHKEWRKVLGGKNWQKDRRPGLDTLDHLTLKVVRET